MPSRALVYIGLMISLNVGSLSEAHTEELNVPKTVSEFEAWAKHSSQSHSFLLRSPVPTFPKKADKKKIGGVCYLIVDVSETRKAENPRSFCSNKVFCKSSLSSIRTVEFLLDDMLSAGATLKNIDYPLIYMHDALDSAPSGDELLLECR